MEDLIIELLELYDNSMKYNKLIDFKNKEYLPFAEILTRSIASNGTKYDGKIIFRDKESFELNAHFIGSYLVKENVWQWGYVHELAETNINMSTRILKYALSFDINKLQREDFKFIRQCLVNSRVKINFDYNFDILMGIILMVTNLKVIIPIKYKLEEQDIIYYYGIDEPENKKYI